MKYRPPNKKICSKYYIKKQGNYITICIIK